MKNAINVKIFGVDMGLLHYHNNEILFDYYPSFIETGLEPSPLLMQNIQKSYSHSTLEYRDWLHLPAMIADTLPDHFGISVMGIYLAQKGIAYNDLSPLEKLSYVGDRGIGATTYEPSEFEHPLNSGEIDLTILQEMCEEVIQEKTKNELVQFSKSENLLQDLMLVSSTAGGAQPKALIHRKGDHILSGLSSPKEGYAYEIIKIINEDTIDEGKIEHLYYKIAIANNIPMSKSELLHHKGFSHFVTQRFDKSSSGEKMHVQTLSALTGEYFRSNTTSFEKIMKIITLLQGDRNQKEDMFRRIAFNIITCNRDDHMKNTSFIMNKEGNWSLSPAYDLTFHCPNNGNTFYNHLITINGKGNNFTENDLISAARKYDIHQPEQIIEQILDNFAMFPALAKEIEVKESKIEEILKKSKEVYKQLKRPLHKGLKH